ncbi:hypothetical protein [Photobacterium damselae]|uniref:hypothetical protein n=1 Tax=Photobacterium damselae TaxID=38293 RepID=UPI001EFC4589|nr:hypothetical protein [Photobacterium damselae]MCG9706484.1 hypothetical protein [Photobacterium damselae]
MRKQHGFMLMGMLIALGFATIFFSMIAENMVIKQIRDQQAIPYKERLLNLKNQVENYQAAQYQSNPNVINSSLLFPRNLKELETKGFLPQCSNTDINHGRCADINKTPWDSSITYQVKGTPPTIPYFAEITIPLPNRNSDGRLYNAFTSVLGSLPDIRFNSSETALLWRINRISDLPALSTQLDQYLKRDGSSSLTGDWDVGERAILNASTITLKNKSGKQTVLGYGTVKEFSVKHGQKIAYSAWDCPDNLKKTIHLTISAKIPPYGEKYTGLAGEIAYIEDHFPDYFIVRMNYNAKLKSTGLWKTMHTGYINVRLNCSLPN